ncbi:MAG: hypothetical protein A2X68_06595 [Ignavibacteria bacterium GWC2_56_12]|nr:MAG: hypothetical protein A2X68_06595 [Ignavibacteria bacterium GWC2_56_12]
MEIRRRDFLKIAAGMTGGALLGSHGLDPMFAVPKEVIERMKFGPRVETWKNTTCRLCPGGCGMSVRLIDDVPISVKGNPLNPVNRGGLCPLGLNAVHSLYHPDRVQGPLIRKGSPGSGSWEKTSWQEAFKVISGKLNQLRQEGKSQHVAFLGSDEYGFMRDHIQRFAASYGTPNYFLYSKDSNKRAANFLSHGNRRAPAYDIVNSKLVVTFGANILEEGPSPVYYTKLYSHHNEQQTRYIHIDSRLNLTAANADRWISIRPGTYGALALGVAYVLIREELYDQDFVRAHTHGFDDWMDARGRRHVGFKSTVLSDYYPERVQEFTGVPSSVILELGRELGNSRPSVALCDQAALNHTNGTLTATAVNALNALLGNYEKEGGVYFVDEPPFASFGAAPMDGRSAQAMTQPRVGMPVEAFLPLQECSVKSFSENVLSGRPYPIDVLFLYGGNPLFQSVHHKKFAQALQKIPMVISFDSLLTETGEFAHYVLPDHHFFEAWDIVSNVENVGFTHVAIQQPVMAPMYDTRATGDVLIELARLAEGRVAASFPYGSYDEGIRRALRGVFESGSGAIASEGVGSRWLEFLKQRGWRIDRYSSFEEFWDRLTRYAGWWNPIRSKKHLRSLFQTPSGKFEFYSQTLENMIQAIPTESRDKALRRAGISAGGDTAFLPHYEPVSGESDLPLSMITYQSMSVGDGRGATLPMMQELFGHAVNRHWDSWAEIHPLTAQQYLVKDGEWILVQSSEGTLRIRSKVTEGVMPNVVAIPFGLGHTSGGRYARGHGVNPHSILEGKEDGLSGREAIQATRVRVVAEGRSEF